LPLQRRQRIVISLAPPAEARFLHSRCVQQPKGDLMGLGTILLIVLILMLVGVLPTWPHSQSWGYGPSGLLGVVVLVLVILVLMGRL
jgi:hypothetical protein